MSEYGFARASDEVLATRTDLADQVVRALRRAGLPAFHEEGGHSKGQPGAEVWVQGDAELGSAPVAVGWSCDPSMIEAAVDSLDTDDPDSPVVRYPGVIGLHMQTALIKILLSAGIIATLENDNMNPEHVLVFGVMSDLPAAFRPTFVPLKV